MAYDRYDTRNDPRDERSRWRDDRFEGRNRDRDWRGGDDDRGFFDRAGDEIASWFGDEDAERRRREDRMRDERDFGGDDRRGRFSGQHRDADRGHFWRDRSWGSGDFDRDEDRGRFSGRERFSERGRDDEWRRDRDRGYRPMTGDYGRSEQFFAAGGVPRGGFGRGEDDRSRFDRSQSQWGRDEYRRTSRAGTSDLSDRSRHEDPHYASWRQRHMDELDRDYDEFRRENQSRFEGDFGGWRERRQQKRGLLGQIREHMDVVGSDDRHVGTIDRVAGDRIILTKSDPESGGAHHSLSCSDIGRVEGDRVILDCTADQARERWRDESRNRALFERDDQGEMGPRVLDRSFEGTYR
ncbi:MAG: DUF2171 domain-containing protein [Sphingomicrobium sp.]